ncbi:MAG TPA: ABC transporter permease [Pyrinomonadaceae bacterium]|nr:ABC transporter permease [Pyrinomonadaceae bacterium]
MSELLTLSLIFSAIRLATPLIFAALGGMFSERSGIINIALEGLMLAGAFTAAVMTFELHNPYLGMLCAVIAGAGLAFVYAVAVIKFEANQVVAGTAINFLMLGLPQLISGAVYDSSGSTPQIPKEFLLPDFSSFILNLSAFGVVSLVFILIVFLVIYGTSFNWLIIPTKESGGKFIGQIIRIFASFAVTVLIFWILRFAAGFSVFSNISTASILAFLIVPICWYVMYKTPFGLRIRAVGENPAAADAAGINVLRMRYTGVILSGVLAAAGGAYLSIGQSSLFTRGMTAGRGFIALAALILAKWKPVPVLLACLFFGFMEALTIPLGNIKLASGDPVPVQFIQIIPYVLTIIVLAGFIGLSRAPKALGIPYNKEK